jgi:allantoin racemase
MADKYRHLYEKASDTHGLRDHCASVRTIDVPSDPDLLFAGKLEDMVDEISETAETAIADDGADMILLGATTMYEAASSVCARIRAPVVKPGPVAIRLAESFIQLDLTHSRVAVGARHSSRTTSSAVVLDVETTRAINWSRRGV